MKALPFSLLIVSLCAVIPAAVSLSSAAPQAPAPAQPETSAAAAAVPAKSTIRSIELPVESGSYRQAEGVELAQTFCLTCHSVEYCETQPPSGAKYWEATVKKMKDKFGAPLPDEAIAPLTRYLTGAYGKTTP